MEKSSHRKVVAIVVAVIVVLAALAGWRLADKYLNPQAAAADNTVSVTVAEATLGDIEVTSVHTGKVTAEDEVNVVPKIPGKVKAVDVALGDRVNKGDVLFEVDPSDVETQADQAEIQKDAAAQGRSAAAEGVSTAKDALKIAREALKDARQAVKDAKKAVKDAKADVTKARKALNDARKLPQTIDPTTGKSPGAEAVAAAQQAVVQAETVLAQAKAAQKQAEAGVTQAKAGVTQAEGGVTQAESAYSQADAQVRLAGVGAEAATVAVGDTTVTAPISGYVTGLTVQKGGMVSQAMPAVVLTGTEGLEVTTTVAENLVSALEPGEEVDVIVRAVSDEPVRGYIHKIVPAPPTGQTTYPVVIRVDEPPAALKPGMFAEVSMVTGRADGAVLVPSDAVIIRDGKEVVAILDGGGTGDSGDSGSGDKVRIVEVETGIDNGEQVEIRSGVSAGDRVVTSGQHYLAEDSKVRITERQAD
jgi:RND family efflux transporter MFP subunit